MEKTTNKNLIEESKEFAEGWNANMEGRLKLVCPYTSELAYLAWQSGWSQCQNKWNSHESAIPLKKNIDQQRYTFV